MIISSTSTNIPSKEAMILNNICSLERFPTRKFIANGITIIKRNNFQPLPLEINQARCKSFSLSIEIAGNTKLSLENK